MAQRPMTSFVERQVNLLCGRWLDGFTKDNVEVSLLQANITLSNVFFKTDELCLLSPTFAPKLVSVGKLSVDIPLSFSFSRPLRITVCDVMVVVKIGTDHISPEDARKAVSASVHVSELLSNFAADLGGEAGAGGGTGTWGADGSGGDDGEGTPPTVTLGTVGAIQKVMQKMEITIKNAHVRLEETEAKEFTEAAVVPPFGKAGTPPLATPPAPSAVAFGICLDQMSLEPDARAVEEGSGGKHSPRSRWVGQKCRDMENAILGNIRFSSANAKASNSKSSGTGATATNTTWGLGKFVSVRGLSAYFCRDEECHTPSNRDETLRRMMERLTNPPEALPPLLRRCRGGLGVRAVMSADCLGKIASVEARFVAGDISVQVTDDHLEYLLRWASLLKNHSRTLEVAATRPVADCTHPAADSLPKDDAATLRKQEEAGEAAERRSRYYRAMWKHAKDVVLRDLKLLVKQRGEEALDQRRRGQHQWRTEYFTRVFNEEGSGYGRARAAVWRLWFGEWVSAARYLAARELLHPHLTVQTFLDEAGGLHDKLYEDLMLDGTPRKTATNRIKGDIVDDRKFGQFLMPWQLPGKDVLNAWDLVRRKCVRWETRQAGGIRLALDEGRADDERTDSAVLQAIWSVQLEMDAQLPLRLCAATRRMAKIRVARRKWLDTLWQARAEKQRRLGLGATGSLTPPRVTLFQSHGWNPPYSLAGTVAAGGARESGVDGVVGNAEAVFGGGEGEIGDGADRVGTLLVRMGQLDGVGGMGMLSLAPKAVAKVMLEESSASLEDLEEETAYTHVARFDGKRARCVWDDMFRLQVELDERYVMELRKQRTRGRDRRSASSHKLSSPADTPRSINTDNGTLSFDRNSSSSSSSPVGIGSVTGNPASEGSAREHGSGDLVHDRRPSGDRRAAVGYADDATSQNDDFIETTGVKDGVSLSSNNAARSASSSRTRSGSNDSVSSVAMELGPRSSFLLSILCVDKGVFGDAELGTVTLPGKELTAASLKVMEHKCVLFSPTAMGREPLELTLQTIFVPPGQDVASCEQELAGVGRLRRLQELQDSELSPSRLPAMRKSLSVAARSPKTLSPKSTGADSGTGTPPQRPSYGEVGSQEFQMPPLRVEDGIAIANNRGTGSNVGEQEGSPTTKSSTYNGSNPEGCSHGNGGGSQQAGRLSASREIPVIHPHLPERVAITWRLAGVKAKLNLNRSATAAATAATAVRVGTRGVKPSKVAKMVQRDSFVTLGQASATGIDVGLNVDVIKGEVEAKAEAAMVEMTDNNLLTAQSSLSSKNGKRGGSGMGKSQVVRVGPVGIDVRGTCHSERMGGERNTSKPGHAFGFELVGPPAEVASSPKTTPKLHSQHADGDEREELKDDEVRERFLNAWSSLQRWDWKGRIRLGAHTAELGNWHLRGEAALSEELCKRLRFVLPSRPSVWRLDETQVLRGALRNESGAESSLWLYLAGGRRLTVDVEIPDGGAHNILQTSSPNCNVCVSSDENEADIPSSQANAVAQTRRLSGPWNRRRTPSQLTRGASEYFPTLPSTTNVSSGELGAATRSSAETSHDPVEQKPRVNRQSTEDDQPSAVAEPSCAAKERRVDVSDSGEGEDGLAEGDGLDFQAGFNVATDAEGVGSSEGLLTTAALMRRVRELEEEVAELRKNASTARAATVVAADALGVKGIKEVVLDAADAHEAGS